MDAPCLTDEILTFIIEPCVGSPGDIWEISVLCTEFCCDYKTTLRNKLYYYKLISLFILLPGNRLVGYKRAQATWNDFHLSGTTAKQV